MVCAINVLLALGLDFILGYAGQLNLGQSAFFGIGAYVSTLLITKLGVPFWGAFAGGVAFAGLAGMVLALFAVRLRGHYLAIASLGFAVIVHQILLNWISLTQGPLGIYGIPPPPPIAIPGLPVDRLPQPGRTVLSGRRLRVARAIFCSTSSCARRSARRSRRSARTRSRRLRSASTRQPGRCSHSASAPRSPAPPDASTRPSSARWCPTHSSSPSRSPSSRW